MARPKKEGMDYFPHDTDAVNDEKIEALRMLYGNDGYAFYFILLERIYRTPEFELDVSDAETIQILSKKVGVNLEVFEKMMATALKRGCFDRSAYEERRVLTSDGVKKRASVVVEKRSKMREKYNKDKDSDVSSVVSDAETTQEIEEESTQRKVKESKGKKSKEDHTTTTADIVHFWENNGFGTVSSHLSQEISGWIDENTFDEPEDIIILAMKEAIEANARTWSYVNTILVSWSNLKLKKEKDVIAHLQGFKNRKANSNNRTGGRNRERCEVDQQATFGNAF